MIATELWQQRRAELVGRRLSEVRTRLRGSPAEALLDRLYAELDERGLVFRPSAELTERWTCQDAPRLCIPFHLADAELAGLGAELAAARDESDPMMLLRHQAGHAFAAAYRLPERSAWRWIFGPGSRPQRERFHADPVARDHVRHLPGWIGQKHPGEDFAETFAVWLAPGGDWREEYARWPALRKLVYVDRVAREIGGHLPHPTAEPPTPARIQGLHYTIDEPFHYSEPALVFGDERRFDPDLRNIFLAPGAEPGAAPARTFIERHDRELVDRIAYWTGEATTVVRALVELLALRADALDLRVERGEAFALRELTAFTTAVVMNYRYTDAPDGRSPGRPA